MKRSLFSPYPSSWIVLNSEMIVDSRLRMPMLNHYFVVPQFEENCSHDEHCHVKQGNNRSRVTDPNIKKTMRLLFPTFKKPKNIISYDKSPLKSSKLYN